MLAWRRISSPASDSSVCWQPALLRPWVTPGES